MSTPWHPAKPRALLRASSASLVAAAFIVILLLISGASAAPTVTTDKAEYFSRHTATISGSGFTASTELAVIVVRPDNSIVKGDGSFTAGCDTVLTGGSGGFVYYYQLDGIEGTDTVRVHLSDPVKNAAGCTDYLSETPVAST